ncbi:ANTAR domain-containing protein [Agromyces sp. NPDC057865]|uniref:ANTAR domain-containing protein n=1 Tax=Agromyces sp. NPDC057865 TaxID=3346267 RepID=UPI00366E330D
MRDTDRHDRILEVFAGLADTLVDDYDVVELLQTLVETCRTLLDVSAAGLLLADEFGDLELVVSTNEESRLVETIQLSAEAGPCIDSYRTALVISVPDIESAPTSWGPFNRAALDAGFRSAYAIPLRLRDTTIGSVNLLRTETGELNAHDLRAAQALADVATIGILHERTMRATETTREQLQFALNTRVVIEQAKGVLAHTHDVSMDQAFEMMRHYARNNQLPLTSVAEQLVQRHLIF